MKQTYITSGWNKIQQNVADRRLLKPGAGLTIFSHGWTEKLNRRSNAYIKLAETSMIRSQEG